ncbi:MAG: hypothetical protein ACRC3J_09950 [Culicoidibacterales bacterium]
MKHKFCYLILAAAMMMGPVPKVHAETTTLPMTVTLIGDATELAFNDEVFLEEPVFLPGNSIERVLTIRNEKSVAFRLSFELERVSATETYDLLNQINVEVYEGETLLCSGIIDENTCDERQLFAVLNPGDERTLRMIATFDENAGNEYKNKFAQYDWIFDAIVTSVPTTGTPVPPVTTPTVTTPTVTVPTTGLPTTGAYSFELFTTGVMMLAVYGGLEFKKMRKARKGGEVNER